MNGDHAAALERLKTFAAEAAADAGPSHAHDIALILELLRDCRQECMAAVCTRRDVGDVDHAANEPGEPTHGWMMNGVFEPCPAYAIRDLPGGV